MYKIDEYKQRQIYLLMEFSTTGVIINIGKMRFRGIYTICKSGNYSVV